MEPSLTISQLARAAGVAVSTVRFYERRRLLLPASRSSGNYRLYSAADAARVRFIRRAQELGFSLSEVSMMLSLSRTGRVLRADVARVADGKLAEIDSRISDLRRVRKALSGLLAQPCIDPTAPCPIVASLAGTAVSSHGRPPGARVTRPSR